MPDQGCYLDSASGFFDQCFGMADLLESFGCDDADLIGSLRAHDGEDSVEILAACLDDAEFWLNENAAEEGYAFGWRDGEFFYLPISEWNES